MVPNLEASDSLPDHGEAWRLPWTVVASSADSVGMSCDGKLVPWRLERRVSLDERLAVSYRYTSVGKEPQRAYWCAHPLFGFEPVLGVSVVVARQPGRTSEQAFRTSASG